MKRPSIICLVFSWIIFSTLINVAFASSGNWVEVTRFEGTGYQTGHFTCDYPEWRIRWEFTPTHQAFHFPDNLKFSITTIGQDNSQGDYSPQGQENSYVVNKIEPNSFRVWGFGVKF